MLRWSGGMTRKASVWATTVGVRRTSEAFPWAAKQGNTDTPMPGPDGVHHRRDTLAGEHDVLGAAMLEQPERARSSDAAAPA